MIKLVTTEGCIDGVKQRIGIVFVTNVATTGMAKDFMAGIKDIFSGKWKGYSKEIEKVTKDTLKEAMVRASEMGADAIVGLRISARPMFTDKLKMFLITVSGTACEMESESNFAAD